MIRAARIVRDAILLILIITASLTFSNAIVAALHGAPQ